VRVLAVIGGWIAKWVASSDRVPKGPGCLASSISGKIYRDSDNISVDIVSSIRLNLMKNEAYRS